ncbi:MAG: flagellar basal body rod protein FlgB [Rhodospirillaceae bacterium]|nr:flagellar basal body rod protein FlgB [Rhodospirillaceae bacterium]
MPIDKITLSDMAMAKLDWAAQRHKVLSQNVANADTPGYKARDLDKFSFKSILQQVAPVEVTRTNPNHLKGTLPGQDRFATHKIPKTSEMSPDGNNVVLEEQMQMVSDAKGAYSTAITLMSAEDRLMKLALGKNGG